MVTPDFPRLKTAATTRLIASMLCIVAAVFNRGKFNICNTLNSIADAMNSVPIARIVVRFADK